VTLWKLSEAGFPMAQPGLGGWLAGVVYFEGLVLRRGGKPRLERHLRFVGDSDTCGFCLEGPANTTTLSVSSTPWVGPRSLTSPGALPICPFVVHPPTLTHSVPLPRPSPGSG